MLIIAWNIQRAGDSGLASVRLDGVLAYLEQLAVTFSPDLICLTECTPALIDGLKTRMKLPDYGGEGYLHCTQERVEAFEALSSDSRGSATKFFSEAVCSFFVMFNRRAVGGVTLTVPDGGRYSYTIAKEAIDEHGRRRKVSYFKEARPLVLVSPLMGATVGLVHLVSGDTSVAVPQLRQYLSVLRQQGGAVLIGDMNIDLAPPGAGSGASYEEFHPHHPGYLTHPGSNKTLDYAWTNGAWQDVECPRMPGDLLQSWFNEEGRLSDHAPVAYRLWNKLLRRVDDLPPFPYPRGGVRTRSSAARPDPQPLLFGVAPADPGRPMVQKPLTDFGFTSSRSYAVTPQQAAALAHAGRTEVPVAADGDCLFSSLVAMSVTASDGRTFASAGALRSAVAEGVRTDTGVRLELLLRGFDPDTVASQIAQPQAWGGLVGDMTPELMAAVLGISLEILNGDGSTTSFGHGTQYSLIRFSGGGAEHYHGTSPASGS